MMMRAFISTILILDSVVLVYCSTAERLDADTRACNWRPNTPKFVDTYSEIESRLAKTGIPKEDLTRLYQVITAEVGYWVKRSHVTHNQISIILSSLIQLDLSKDLDRRDCFDHCTFVLAKNNCNAAIHLHACRPRSGFHTSHIKSALDAKVFSLIERCQVPLMYHAVFMNATDISPQLYRVVQLIAERMVDTNHFSRWNSNQDMVLRSTRPFFNTRRLIRPADSGFFDQIAQLMVDAEKANGGDALLRDIKSGKILAPDARSHFHRLVIQPCLEYISRMHTAMDATIFYGRISELDAKRFNKVFMSSTMRVKYFELVKLYEACVFLDNAKYTINWRYEAYRLTHSEDPSWQHLADYRRSREIGSWNR